MKEGQEILEDVEANLYVEINGEIHCITTVKDQVQQIIERKRNPSKTDIDMVQFNDNGLQLPIDMVYIIN